MGSSSSKFRKQLQNGEEYAALQLYESSADLRKALDPNLSYGESYQHDTPLHLVAKHAMKPLLRIFLSELNGNPNKKNAVNQTSLHMVCTVNPSSLQRQSAKQRRLECLQMILQWKGAIMKDGQIEKVDLGAQDDKENTALHYAAMSGLKKCVEFLVASGCPLFTENEDKHTPCDSAEKAGHSDIALYLESKMVFSCESTASSNEDDAIPVIEEIQEEYSGLRAQDLQEAKDQLLVETSDMLRVPLFTAEALLRNHEWSREMLLEAWMKDAVSCCEKCGVIPPTSIFQDLSSMDHHSEEHRELRTPTSKHSPKLDVELECDICTLDIPNSDDPVHMMCDHHFCRNCWKGYLNIKIKEGDAHNITCPGYDCSKLVPVEIIEELVSRDMARRYLQFDIKAFVESNPNIKWCPFPGCGRAVKLPEGETNLMSPVQPSASNKLPTDTSRSVDCGVGHYFCWECMGEAHAPASCDSWQKWFQKIQEVRPEHLGDTEGAVENSANILWLVTNSKSCPNCRSPIQKNEGCNHMKCSKCKYDYCWVCLEPWKKHSSATGGYFRCNRYEVSKKVEDQNEQQKNEAQNKHKANQELNKFVHYYTRFKNHENSYKLEEPLLTSAKEKMLILAKAIGDAANADVETQFVEDAVKQLLKARRILKCSYVYGYYIEEVGIRKPIFEFMQTELEEATEHLSQMINRPYLRTPRSKIINQAQLVTRKRHDMIGAIVRGLVPMDLSPFSSRKKYSFDVDEDMKKALLASIQDSEISNPWVLDRSGRHANISALFDWPDSSDSDTDEDEITDRSSAAGTPSSPKVISTTPEAGLCKRPGCAKSRAKNPRTGTFQDYCSLRCLRIDKVDLKEQRPLRTTELVTDYQMDLLRALEMSRLQLLRDMASLGPVEDVENSPFVESTSSTSPPESSITESEKPQASSNPTGTSQASINSPSLPRPNRKASLRQRLEGLDTDADDFDVDLQRALELSRATEQDDDSDLRLAIQLSLGYPGSKNSSDKPTVKESKSNPLTVSTPKVPSEGPENAQQDELLGACGYTPETKINDPTNPAQAVADVTVHVQEDGENDHCDIMSLLAETNIPEPEAAVLSDEATKTTISPEKQGSSDHEKALDDSVQMLLAYTDSLTLGSEKPSAGTASKVLQSDEPRSPSVPDKSGVREVKMERSCGKSSSNVQEVCSDGSIEQALNSRSSSEQATSTISSASTSEDPQCSGTCHGAIGTSFGLIKNISVNNILAMDVDKIKDFDKKDFSQLLLKTEGANRSDENGVHVQLPGFPSSGSTDDNLGPTDSLLSTPATTALEEWTAYLTSTAISTSPSSNTSTEITYSGAEPTPAETENIPGSVGQEVWQHRLPVNVPTGNQGMENQEGQNDLNRSVGESELATSLWARTSTNQITLDREDSEDAVYV